ncbi:MAG TPA: hypothetical protein EYP63_06070 [Desulfotomaculum sp.]|nr:hypothetical protein [Desulfotomaculum sp.]
MREVNRSLVPVQCMGLERIGGDHCVVFYPQGEEEAAKLVLRTAERFFPVVADEFGVKLKRRVPVVLYREQSELNRVFGWPADEGTMGVYWGGNYPRWLTEGLAQEMERRLTGFRLEPPAGFPNCYPFSVLDDFDSLPDERLAYYQSYLMVGYLLEHGGDAKLKELLAELGRGCSFASALERTMGYGVSEFESRFVYALLNGGC